MHLLQRLLSKFSRTERIIAAIAAIGLLTGLAGFYTVRFLNGGEVPASGGAWREAMVGQPAYINPVLARTPADIALSNLIFAPLAELADKIEATDKGKTIRVHLKEGLLWSDGREVSSDDVLFTIATIQDPDARSPRAPDWQSVRTERVSQLELNLTLPAPYSGFEKTVGALLLAPKHLFENVPVANWKLSEYMTLPVGNGPYLMSSRRVERDGFINSIELRKNQKFISEGGGPFIEVFTFLFAAREEEALAMFNTGTADGVLIRDQDVAGGIRRPFQIVRYASPTVYAVFWNQNANPALEEGSVRRALSFAINREEIAAIAKGTGEATATPLPKVLANGIETGSSTVFSLDDAKTTLEAAGWEQGDLGIREKRVRGETRRLEFALLVPDISPLPEVALKLREVWLSVGVDAKITKMPLEEMRSGALKNRTYEAILFGNTFDGSGDLFPFWHSSQKFHPGLNLALYGSRDLDGVLSNIRETMDQTEREKERAKAASGILEANPALFLFSEVHLYAAKKDLKGTGGTIIEAPADRFKEAAKWYLRTR